MVADIIIIAVFALLFFIDFKRGIAITILNVAGVALTGFLAYHISNFLASWVYTAFVQQTLTTNLQQMIDTQGINSAIANSFSALPNWVMGMLGFFLSIFGLDSSVYTNDFQVPNSAAAAVSASVEIPVPCQGIRKKYKCEKSTAPYFFYKSNHFCHRYK